MAVLDIVDKGGLLVYPILACSLIGTTIFFSRLLLYRNVEKHRSRADGALVLIRQGDVQQALELLRRRDNDYTVNNKLLIEALTLDAPDLEMLEMVLGHAVAHQIDSLSRHLSTLAVLGTTAPMLGLLGTVVGMIKAFMVVESMGGSVNASVLAGGIWEAMLTTALGLLAAIPLMFFHNHLQTRLNAIQKGLEAVAIDYVKTWKRHASAEA